LQASKERGLKFSLVPLNVESKDAKLIYFGSKLCWLILLYNLNFFIFKKFHISKVIYIYRFNLWNNNFKQIKGFIFFNLFFRNEKFHSKLFLNFIFQFPYRLISLIFVITLIKQSILLIHLFFNWFQILLFPK
jgi:hypothetical protein